MVLTNKLLDPGQKTGNNTGERGLASIRSLETLMEIDTDKYTLQNEALRLASAVQNALLAEQLPQCDCGKLVVRHRMSESVGGDFYHFRRLGQDQVAFAVGDAIGHGTAAALIMSIIMGLLRADRLDNRRPCRVVGGVNDLLLQLGNQTGYPITCSMIYGVVDLPSGLLLYVNAGHPHPIVSNRQTGKTQELGPTTTLLGVRPGIREESCHKFEQNDRLVLFTDGLTEVQDGCEQMFGERRLLELVKKTTTRPPEELLAAIFEQADAFCDHVPQNDDQTLVVIDFDNVSNEF